MNANATKKPCQCGYPDKWAANPNCPVEFDQTFNEYRLILKDECSYYVLYFCFYCGGELPESKRAAMFAQPDKGELESAYAQLEGATSVADVLHRLGKPDAIEPVCR